MFEHSVKVPRHYKIAANIFKKVSTEGGSVKTLLYDDKLRHFRTNVIFALLTETIKHAADIDKIFQNCNLMVKEPRLDPWLAKVLTAELLFGKKSLPGKSKPEQTILSYKEEIEHFASENQVDLKTEAIRRPRYVRINTNLLTTSDAIRAFQDEGYRFIRCTSGSYNDYLEQIKALSEYDFTQDYHVKTVFVFPVGTKLYEHELYLENKIILQDKATAMAVHLLAPPPNSTILDMCAAPGMKTTQLAAFIRNQGKIYAIERNEKRYQTLCDFVEKTGSKCVEPIHRDALEIRKGEYLDVEYILLDPSCSGSGMELSVHNYIDEERLAKLTSLQEKFLKHAMNSFPNAKRIVYSTCSVFPEENERVITNIVKSSRSKWRVQDIKDLLKRQWNNFGSGMYGSIGSRCMYAKPDSDLTTGFFLAVLDRDEADLARCRNQKLEKADMPVGDDNQTVRTKKVRGIQNIDNNLPQGDINVKKRKKDKKKERNSEVDSTNITEGSVDTNEAMAEEPPRKKKKKKDKNKEESLEAISTELSEITLDNSTEKSKKKKRKDRDNIDDQDQDTTVEDTVSEYIPKKKKKKERMTEENDLAKDSHLNYIEMDENEALIAIKKKKKKKRDSIASES